MIEPHALSAADREQLIDDLYAVQCDVFEGVDRESFARYVVNSTAEATWIEVLIGEEGRIVGYFAIHRFDREMGGRPASVFRAEAGIARTHRGGGSLGSLLFRKLVPHRLAHPQRKIFFLGCFVHPSSYVTFEAVVRVIYPHRRGETPPGVQRLMCALGDEFGLEVVDPEAPLVRRVGWITRDTEVERAYWQKCTKAGARYFIEANPGYVEGDGLLTLVPVDAANLVVAGYRFVRRKLSRRWGRIRASLQTIFPTMRRLSPKVLEEMLASVPMLQGLDEQARAHIAEGVHQTVVPPGRYLFRRGDRGDAMHMIAAGAAYVVLEAEGDRPEIVLDELVRGEVLGEMALLSGEARTASIRAASSLSLVTVDKATFDGVLEAQPALADAAWAAFARRRLDTYLSAQPRFAHLGPGARDAWAARGTVLVLVAGETLSLGATPFVFVVTGTVELDIAGTWLTADAPMLVAVGGASTLRAASSARVMQLPGVEAVEGATC